MDQASLDHLLSLQKRADNTQHPYAACIAGMWANYYGVPHAKKTSRPTR